MCGIAKSAETFLGVQSKGVNTPGAELGLSETLKPSCPRDNHHTKYEARGIQWKAATNDHVQSMAPPNHCNFQGAASALRLRERVFHRGKCSGTGPGSSTSPSV